MGKHNREKGKRGEREAAKALSKVFGAECRRGVQYSGLEGRDVVGLEGVHIEVKRTEALSIYKAMEQAVRDANPADTPIVLHRRNGKPWLVIVVLNDLPDLAAKLSEASS